jgi:EAL domain-containing protein (putative c-di-GMP-specific phosphodiesterase class I)
LAPNTLSFLDLEIPVLAARWISGAIFLLALVGVGWMGWPLLRAWRHGDASQISVQYAPLLIDIRPGGLGDQGQIIEVATFQDLAKLAERYGAVILHEALENSNVYSIQDEGITYQFKLEDKPELEEFPDTPSFWRALQKAIDEDEFVLYYQPVVALDDQSILSVEALLRWDHPQLGILYPDEFIPRAKGSGLIDQIDDWVIQAACQQLVDWESEGVSPFNISINVSSDRLIQGDFVTWLSKLIDETGCDATKLQFEISHLEPSIKDELAQQNLKQLQALGISVILDNISDSDLDELNEWNYISSLKLNRNVVQKILEDPEDTRMVGNVVDLARQLGLPVMAIGVETPEQLEFLKSKQVFGAQGNWYYHPMPVSEMESLMKKDSEPEDSPEEE